MGSRDYRHRETKKPKKTAKKSLATEIFSPEATSEVVKKKKPEPKEEEKE